MAAYSATYVANWLKVLREDSRAIFTAANRAQQAVDYMHTLQPQHNIEGNAVSQRPAFDDLTPNSFAVSEPRATSSGFAYFVALGCLRTAQSINAEAPLQ